MFRSSTITGRRADRHPSRPSSFYSSELWHMRETGCCQGPRRHISGGPARRASVLSAAVKRFAKRHFQQFVCTQTYVSMTKYFPRYAIVDKFSPRLAKNLRSCKGSRRANTGNRLEHRVLTRFQHVP